MTLEVGGIGFRGPKVAPIKKNGKAIGVDQLFLENGPFSQNDKNVFEEKYFWTSRGAAMP